MIRLASASPRRRQLLESVGFRLVVSPSAVDEAWDGRDPVPYARHLATEKARLAPTDLPVVAADTIVHRDGQLFDKPRDRQAAAVTLRALSGGWHAVTTAYVVRTEATHLAGDVTTHVRFRALTDADIERYLATGEADDKAGAYGIQGLGASLVATVEGSFSNVVGLPLDEVLEALAVLGVRP